MLHIPVEHIENIRSCTFENRGSFKYLIGPKQSLHAVASLTVKGCVTVHLTACGTWWSLVALRRLSARLKTLSLWVIFSLAFELNPFSGGFGLKAPTVVWEIWINQEICIQTAVYWRIKDLPPDFFFYLVSEFDWFHRRWTIELWSSFLPV